MSTFEKEKNAGNGRHAKLELLKVFGAMLIL